MKGIGIDLNDEDTFFKVKEGKSLIRERVLRCLMTGAEERLDDFNGIDLMKYLFKLQYIFNIDFSYMIQSRIQEMNPDIIIQKVDVTIYDDELDLNIEAYSNGEEISLGIVL